MKIKATQGVLAFAASLALFSGPAAAEFQDFVIDENSVDGTSGYEPITADKLNGGYTELITLYPDFTFATNAYGTFGQTYANEGSLDVANNIGCRSADCYNMYVLFEATGVYGATGFTGLTGEFHLWIDPASDTALSFGAGDDGSSSPTVDDVAGDDYEIAFATDPEYLIGLPGVPGAYDFVWGDFTLTDEGKLYFIDPDPFHFRVQVNGDFDSFAIEAGTARVTGDMSAVFKVPAPTTLALFGLGLAGLGLRNRRKA